MPNDRKSANQVDKLLGVSILIKNKEKNFIFYTRFSLNLVKYKQLENKASEFICVWASRVAILVVKNPSAFEGDIRDEGLILQRLGL